MKANEDQQIENALRAYSNRLAFRQKLDQIHAAMDPETLYDSTGIKRLGQPSSELWPEQNGTDRAMPGRVRKLWQVYRPILAVAASVAVFTTFATIGLYRSYQSSTIKQEEQYSMLRRDLQAIRQSQNALLQDMGGRFDRLKANPGQVAGSGFLLTPDGYMVTNNHIVQDADSVYVQSQKGDVFKAKIVHTDREHDLAILQLCDDNAFRPLPPLPYSFDSRPSDLGERVFTMGYPREEIVYGEGYLSSGTGYRGDSTAYQVAISVNPGNSGGPLVDEKGNVIGIITGKQKSSEGATFAIKTKYLAQALDNIPTDSVGGVALNLNHRNALTKLPRKQQIKRMQEYVYQVKVFKH